MRLLFPKRRRLILLVGLCAFCFPSAHTALFFFLVCGEGSSFCPLYAELVSLLRLGYTLRLGYKRRILLPSSSHRVGWPMRLREKKGAYCSLLLPCMRRMYPMRLLFPFGAYCSWLFLSGAKLRLLLFSLRLLLRELLSYAPSVFLRRILLLVLPAFPCMRRRYTPFA